MLAPLTPAEWDAILLSLRVASLATIATLPIAVGLALVLARGRFPGRFLLDAVVHLPLVLPPVVVGFVLLVAFGRNGVFGAPLADVGIVLAFRWTGAALAAAVMGLPLMVRAIRLSLETVDRRLEGAAATLGAGRLDVFLSVTLPLVAPGIVAGAVLMFARALGEFGATITFVGNIPGATQTIPSAIFEALQVPGGDASAWRLTVVAVVVSLVALVLSDVAARRVAARSGR